MDEKKKLVSVVVRKRSLSNSPKIRDMCATIRNECKHGTNSDILGSYTGTPVNGNTPVQDADDL